MNIQYFKQLNFALKKLHEFYDIKDKLLIYIIHCIYHEIYVRIENS